MEISPHVLSFDKLVVVIMLGQIGVILKSSIPIPSSDPDTFTSNHLKQIVPPAGISIPKIVSDITAEC